MRVVLHRCGLRSDHLCACGRIARELRARGIEVEQRRVPLRRDRREEVRALTGQDRVPVLVIGDEVICDSHRIIEHLRWRDGLDELEEGDEAPAGAAWATGQPEASAASSTRSPPSA